MERAFAGVPVRDSDTIAPGSPPVAPVGEGFIPPYLAERDELRAAYTANAERIRYTEDDKQVALGLKFNSLNDFETDWLRQDFLENNGSRGGSAIVRFEDGREIYVRDYSEVYALTDDGPKKIAEVEDADELIDLIRDQAAQDGSQAQVKEVEVGLQKMVRLDTPDDELILRHFNTHAGTDILDEIDFQIENPSKPDEADRTFGVLKQFFPDELAQRGITSPDDLRRSRGAPNQSQRLTRPSAQVRTSEGEPGVLPDLEQVRRNFSRMQEEAQGRPDARHGRVRLLGRLSLRGVFPPLRRGGGRRGGGGDPENRIFSRSRVFATGLAIAALAASAYGISQCGDGGEGPRSGDTAGDIRGGVPAQDDEEERDPNPKAPSEADDSGENGGDDKDSGDESGDDTEHQRHHRVLRPGGNIWRDTYRIIDRHYPHLSDIQVERATNKNVPPILRATKITPRQAHYLHVGFRYTIPERVYDEITRE